MGLFGKVTEMTKTPPAATPAETGWLCAGAVLMGLLLYFRQFFFWLPHPIGLIMLVNPIMSVYWFSILIGWLAKYVVTKYGNKDAYTHMRNLFIGLILGELLLVVVSMVLSVWMGKDLGISLNRSY